MYLSTLKLWNFRKFGNDTAFNLQNPDLNLGFNNGINVLIGENDSGKTAIVDAIKLVLKTHSYEWIRIAHDDFYGKSERFRIEIVFEGLLDVEAKNFTEWLGWSGDGDEAKPFLRLIYDVKKQGIKVFPSDVRAGVDDDGQQLSAEAREYLKTTYLKPLRDAKTDLIPKRNSRLSQILQGHEAFKNRESDHHLIELFNDFNSSVEKYFEGKGISIDDNGNTQDVILTDENGKKLKEEIDGYIKSFYDDSTETEITVIEGSLKSILEKLELSIKNGRNLGLGTLNRLFMASELLHLNKKDWSGLRLGLVEELEAHLHPQAQMQVIESLQKQENIQLILTTHSPNLASKVSLENLIICNGTNAFPMGQSHTRLEAGDYLFLEKFLDVTKSNLFFAKGVILVEGWSEEIFLPSFAKLLKREGIISKDLTEAGVSIVNVGSTALLRYSKIFQRVDIPEITIPIAVITDSDIREYEKKVSVDEDGKTIRIDDKVVYEYPKRVDAGIAAERLLKIQGLKTKYDGQYVESFIAPYWTFEYSLHLSSCLGTKFREVVLNVHPQMDSTKFEEELGRKLINKGLNKTEIAYQFALSFEEDLPKDVINKKFKINPRDSEIKYLINAIKHACNV
jgi:putative ATP-dependent endonuclease of OLD family